MRAITSHVLLTAVLACVVGAQARSMEVSPGGAVDPALIHASGVFPHITVTADSGPKRSECGIGAMLPWADKLYVISYLSVPNAGSGTGLYTLDEAMNWERVKAHNSTYANRMIVPALDSIVIGPYVIDQAGGIRVIEPLLSVRIGGMAMHLTDPHSVYMLGMDGPLWEVNLTTLQVTHLFDLPSALGIPDGEQPHFKAAHSMSGWLYVATNTFFEADYMQNKHGGRLAAWNGSSLDPSSWNIIDDTAFVEIAGRANFGKVVFASGWDDRSSILKVLDNGDAADPTYDANWQTYRVPTSSHTWSETAAPAAPRAHAACSSRPSPRAVATTRPALPTCRPGLRPAPAATRRPTPLPSPVCLAVHAWTVSPACARRPFPPPPPRPSTPCPSQSLGAHRRPSGRASRRS